MSSIFNMCHIFIGYISCMFYVLELFLRFFCSLLVNWLGGTSSETPSNESVKNVRALIDSPKPSLHAFLSPWMKI